MKNLPVPKRTVWMLFALAALPLSVDPPPEVAVPEVAVIDAGSSRTVSLAVSAAPTPTDETSLSIDWRGQCNDRLLVLAVEAIEERHESSYALSDGLSLPGLVIVRRVSESNGISTITIKNDALVDLFGQSECGITVLVVENLDVLIREDRTIKGGGRVLEQKGLQSTDVEPRWELACTPESQSGLDAFDDIQPMLFDVPAPAYLDCSVAMRVVDALVRTSLRVGDGGR